MTLAAFNRTQQGLALPMVRLSVLANCNRGDSTPLELVHCVYYKQFAP